MNVSQLITDIKLDEGFRSCAYHDTRGLLTIGYGRLIDGRGKGGITHAEADYLLANDISRVVSDIEAHLPWAKELSEARQRALANMAFQMGIHGLLEFKDMLAAMQVGNFDAAASEAEDSEWAEQTPQRAKRIAAAIKNG